MRYEKFENIVVIAIAAAFAVVQIHFALAVARGALHARSEHAASIVMMQTASLHHLAAAQIKG